MSDTPRRKVDLETVLSAMARASTGRPRTTVCIAVAAALLAVAFTTQLQVSSSRNAMVDQQSDYWQRYMRFVEEFGMPEDLVVVFQGDDPQQVHRFLDEAARRIEAKPLVESVFYRVDFDSYRDRAAFYLDPAHVDAAGKFASLPALGELRVRSDGPSRIQAAATLLDRSPGLFADQPSNTNPETRGALADTLAWMMQELKRFAEAGGDGGTPLRLMDPVLVERSRAKALAGSGLDSEGYLTAEGGRIGVLFVRRTDPSDELERIRPFVAEVREACERAQREAHLDEVQFGFTGNPAAQVDDVTALFQDMPKTTTVALIGVILLFLIYFPAIRLMSMSMVPVVLGALWSYAAIAIAYGHLTLISSVCVVVVIGLGIDFAVHINSRFLEQRRDGKNSRDAAIAAVSLAGRGVAIGGLTSVAAFVAVSFSDFRGIAELGTGAAVGLGVALLAAFTVLPALLTLLGPAKARHRQGFPGFPSAARFILRSARPVLAVAVLVTAGLAVFVGRFQWDLSIMNMLPRDADSAVLYELMLEHRELSPNAIVTATSDLESARALQEELAELPTVFRAVSAASFVPADQEARHVKLREMAATLEKTRRAAAAATSTQSPEYAEALDTLLEAVERIQEMAFSAGDGEAVAKLEAAVESIEAVQTSIEAGDEASGRARRGLNAFAAALVAQLENAVGILENNVDGGPVAVSELPAGIRTRFVGRNHKFAVYAFPEGDMFVREQLGAFLDEARTVAPELTGFPESYYYQTALMREGFLWATIYASIAVLIFLLLDLGRVGPTVLAILPLAVGSLWMIGIQNLSGGAYNLSNVIALPLLVGIGIDNGVHLVHRYLQEGCLETALIHTGGAVSLSSLTTVAGFGSLALASHRGISSLGMLLVLGVCACMLSSLVVLPAFLACVEGQGARKQPA